MKYTNLIIESINEDERFFKLATINDSGKDYVVLGKVLCDPSLSFDSNIGAIYIEETRLSISNDILYNTLHTIENEDEKKAIYGFVQSSGLTFLFGDILYYIYIPRSYKEKDQLIVEKMEKLKLRNGLDRFYKQHEKDILKYRTSFKDGVKIRIG